jgi:hypothetical protein
MILQHRLFGVTKNAFMIVEILKDIFQFREMGLWAILIALLLFGLREAAKRIEDQTHLTVVFLLAIVCMITIGYKMYDFEKQKQLEKDKQEKEKQHLKKNTSSLRRYRCYQVIPTLHPGS